MIIILILALEVTMDGKKVLIIDDETHVRMLYSEELTQLGYSVSDNDGSGDICSLLEQTAPDLVILDIKLGDRSGLDVLQEIRRKNALLPVILCTAYASFSADLKSIAADAYVVKSYDSSELLEQVRRLTAD